MENHVYPLKKLDTRLYVKGLSGPLVYRAVWGIIGAFVGFSGLYILAGVFAAVLLVVPAFFCWLYRLNTIQKRFGPDGWSKKQSARKLPQFISCKRRVYHSLSSNANLENR